jgi:hypothetical protein
MKMNRPLFKRVFPQAMAWAAVAALSGVFALAQDAATAAGQRTDGQIEMDVVHALDASQALKNDLITAATIQSEVTLSGTVSSEASRKLAESIAGSVAGVSKIHDNLKVGNPADDQNAQGAYSDDSASQDMAENQPQPPAAVPAPGYPQGNAPNYPQGNGPGYPQGNAPNYPQGDSQGYPQGNAPNYPQGNAPNYPQGNAQGYPQGNPPNYPQGNAPNYPQGNAQGYPQGNAQGYPQGNAPNYPQGNAQGYPQGNAPGYPPGYGQNPYPPAPPSRGQYAQPAPPNYAMPKGPVNVPQGTLLQLRTAEAVDTKRAKDGTPIQFTLIQDVVFDGVLAIPRGATVHGVVAEVKRPGAVSGSPELGLQLTSLDLGGQNYPLQTEMFKVRGPNKAGRTVGNAFGGAILGAIIGGAVDRGPGAAIGAAAGAGAGTAASAASPGPGVWIPAEALVTFHLAAPVTVNPVSREEANRLAQGLYPGGPSLYRRGPYGYPYRPYPYGYGPVYYRPYFFAGGSYYWR